MNRQQLRRPSTRTRQVTLGHEGGRGSGAPSPEELLTADKVSGEGGSVFFKGVCISYFSDAMTKNMTEVTCGRVYFGLWFYKGKSPLWWRQVYLLAAQTGFSNYLKSKRKKKDMKLG